MSLTSKTKTRRALRAKKAGRDNRKARTKAATPKFPLDPAKAGPDSAEKRPAADKA